MVCRACSPAPAAGWSNCNSNCNSRSRSGFPVGWRGGSGCGRRRKPIHGGLAAASMPRTLPQPAPPRLRHIFGICRNGSWGQIRFPAENGSDPRLISISDRDSSTHGVDPTAADVCQRRGGVGVRGVSRMDAAAKPPWTDSRRPRTPTLPRHPKECPHLTLTLTPQVQGCKPCRKTLTAPVPACARSPSRSPATARSSAADRPWNGTRAQDRAQ